MGSGSFYLRRLELSLWPAGPWGLGRLRAWGFYSGMEQGKDLTRAAFHQGPGFRIRKAWVCEPRGAWTPLPPLLPPALRLRTRPPLCFLRASPRAGGHLALLV